MQEKKGDSIQSLDDQIFFSKRFVFASGWDGWNCPMINLAQDLFFLLPTNQLSTLNSAFNNI